MNGIGSLPKSQRAGSFAAVRYAAWLFDTGSCEESIAQPATKKSLLDENKGTPCPTTR